MRMAQRNGQGIRRIRPYRYYTGQLQTHHMFHLSFIRMADPDHNLFHRIGGVFGDL
jgi:hypothetical protein